MISAKDDGSTILVMNCISEARKDLPTSARESDGVLYAILRIHDDAEHREKKGDEDEGEKASANREIQRGNQSDDRNRVSRVYQDQ